MTTPDRPFRRILLIKHHRRPSERVLAVAAGLARRTAARLTFAHALEGGDRIDELSQGERRRELEALLAPHVGAIEVDYRLLSGDLVTVVEQAADDFDLVIPAEGEPGSEAAARQLLRLLRSSPLPVWLDGSRREAPRSILAAVDVQTRNPLKQALNLPILRRALRLASAFDARLDLLSILTPPPASERLARRLAGTTGSTISSQRRARERLAELAAEAGGASLDRQPRLLIARGDADTLIAQAAETAAIDLLVAGCVGRTGLAAWLVGDTAERLSGRLGCSILAVKPTPEQLDESAAGNRTRAA